MNTRNASLPRRGFLLGLTAAGASLGLAGCGFELRKAPIFAFKTLSLEGNTFFINQLRRDLRAAGTVTLVPTDQAKTADAVLVVLGEDRARFIVSTDSAGLLREVQLRLGIRFRLSTPDGKELLAATEVAQTRDLSYNETNALAKEAEADLLYRDMQTDIGQQVMRRLAAVKSL